MTLETRVTALATDVADEFNTLRVEIGAKDVIDKGDVSGVVNINYSEGKLYFDGQVQKITPTANVTALTVSNWLATGKSSKLTLYIDLASALTVDFGFVTGWAIGSAPTLAVGRNELVFTTIDGGAKIIGHAVALGI